MSTDALTTQWALSFSEITFVETSPRATRLGLAAQLKFFQNKGYLPSTWEGIGVEARDWLAEQLGIVASSVLEYRLGSRTGRRHGAEIKRHLGLRRFSEADRTALAAWIAEWLCPQGLSPTDMLEAALTRCREDGVWVASRKVIERLVRSERRLFVDAFLARMTAQLSPETIERLETGAGRARSADGLSYAEARRRRGHARQRAGRARATRLHPRP